jgi:protein gp37
MNKTKIEWADYTWNPIKGLCPVGCWYCYARKIYQRFKLDPEPRLLCPTPSDPVPAKGRIFVCSTFELFHPVADSWRGSIFDTIQDCSNLTFIVLTKMPERIDRPMPDNVWLGVTVTSSSAGWRIRTLAKKEARVKFVSFEPVLSPQRFCIMKNRPVLDWYIVGRLTGHGNVYDPSREDIKAIVDFARYTANKPVFMKDNLKKIWGEPLIQEWPDDDRED